MGERPVIAITMGDPCGIGAEVIAKALARPAVGEWCTPLVVGNAEIMRRAFELTGAGFEVRAVESADDIVAGDGAVAVLDIGNYDAAGMRPGEISATAGKAAMEWVVRAGELCLNGSVTAMATAPLHKEAASLAGYEDIGHMEVLQRLSESPKVLTMLVSKGLRVVHLTTHRSLKRACDYVTQENILGALRLTDSAFKTWGFPEPRIGVAALNPHASDGGLIGDEEATQISPAVEAALAEGIDAKGPVPADSVFLQGVRGDYDAVLAMYHDQGHIAVKMYGFEESITVNLGLPFIRTSVDHGTAFDIAWQNKADDTSMVESIKVAVDLATGTGIAG
ncbi:MAG: 4-hydroxythreonine-4-phosphate dehydrogenase PdxA [Chloroflexota bacterium]|nr:4-hydroxythreonine-4-phosphate dehydrogenase PdxA [Chloroflexota bacterium]